MSASALKALGTLGDAPGHCGLRLPAGRTEPHPAARGPPRPRRPPRGPRVSPTARPSRRGQGGLHPRARPARPRARRPRRVRPRALRPRPRPRLERARRSRRGPRGRGRRGRVVPPSRDVEGPGPSGAAGDPRGPARGPGSRRHGHPSSPPRAPRSCRARGRDRGPRRPRRPGSDRRSRGHVPARPSRSRSRRAPRRGGRVRGPEGREGTGLARADREDRPLAAGAGAGPGRAAHRGRRALEPSRTWPRGRTTSARRLPLGHGALRHHARPRALLPARHTPHPSRPHRDPARRGGDAAHHRSRSWTSPAAASTTA